MTIIARGADKVRGFEAAIGGEPPKRLFETSRDSILAFLSTRSQERARRRDQFRAAMAQQQEILLGAAAQSQAVKEQQDALRADVKRRSATARKELRLEKMEPRVVSGSSFAIHAPPYDHSFATTGATADAAAGTYDVNIQSLGDGNIEAAAGVASFFFNSSADQPGRCAARILYFDDWWDAAFGYVAHNYFQTRLWVFSGTEGNWVCQADVAPQWSDGASWFDNHGNNPGEDAATSAEVFFPVVENGWYLAWIWCDAQVYGDSGIGFLASGWSSLQFDASIPWMMFGSL